MICFDLALLGMFVHWLGQPTHTTTNQLMTSRGLDWKVDTALMWCY